MSNIILNTSTWSLLVCGGPGNRKFLQGHLTCDIAQLSTTDSILGAACDLKGRVAVSMIILSDDNPAANPANQGRAETASLLLLPKDMVSPLCELWNKYLMLYRGVTLQEYGGDFRVQLELVGNDKEQQVSPGSNGMSSSSSDNAIHRELIGTGAYLTCASPNADNLSELPPVSMAKSATMPDNTSPPVERAVSSDVISATIASKLEKADSLTAFFVNKHVPFVNLATSGLMIPQAMNYEELGGISFTKGCYLGQEVVARVYYKGKSPRSCQPVSFALTNDQHSIMPGTPIYAIVNDKQTEVGRLINCYATSGEKDREMKVKGLALLSNNSVDLEHLFINNQPITLK